MRGIITLCGSTRFLKEFNMVSLELTLSDYIILSVGAFLHSDSDLKDRITEKDKERLDALHKEKIEMSQSVVILNKNGYVGQSTTSEILHAISLRKDIYWLEPDKIPERLIGALYLPQYRPPHSWKELLENCIVYANKTTSFVVEHTEGQGVVNTTRDIH